MSCPDSITPHQPATIIIDGQALVVAVGKPVGAITFGDFADTFYIAVIQIGRTYTRIDIIFDRYRVISIKTCQPIRRLVEGRDVLLPQNLGNFIALTESKSDLVNFLN
jgi:hypothetical protein